MSSIKEKVIKMLDGKIKAKELSDIQGGDDLVYDLGIDSFEMVNLIIDLETEFDIEIEDTEMKRLMKIDSMLDYLAEKTGV